MLFLAALAWILGTVSLLLFGVFLWTGGLDIFELGLPDRSLVTIDAALCAVFFLQHSVLIRRSVRTALKKFIPEYCYGAAYTVASGAILLLLVLLWQRATWTVYALSGIGRVATRAALVLAFVGFFWGIRSLKKFDAFGIDALRAHVRGEHETLVQLTVVGPYRFVRHPFYAFSIVALWATPQLSIDRLVLNALFTGWIWLGALLEERDLLEEFGEEYAQYRKAVPMLVPRLWRLGREVARTKGAAGGRAA